MGFPGGQAPWVTTNAPADILIRWGGGNALKGVWDEATIHDVKLDGQNVVDRFLAGPTYPLTVASEAVVGGETTGTEFTSQPNTTYTLQYMDANGWEDTGAFANGDGSDIILFDPAGYSTSKQYRINFVTD